MNEVSDFIRHHDLKNPLLLRDLRHGRLVVTSDYGGEHSAAGFATYSFFLFNDDSLAPFFESIADLRNGKLRPRRRIAYKSLGDGIRADALVPFLRSSNSIHGVLFTVAIEKNAVDLFGSGVVDEELKLLPGIKRSTAEKLLTVCHWLSVFVSGLVGPAQDLVWLSDRDNIAANSSHRDTLCRVFGHFLNHYLNCDIGHIRVGTTENDPGNLWIEDLASIPDLAAGALAEVLTSSGCRSRAETPVKAHPIVGWLFDQSGSLAKANIVIRRSADGEQLIPAPVAGERLIAGQLASTCCLVGSDVFKCPRSRSRVSPVFASRGDDDVPLLGRPLCRCHSLNRQQSFASELQEQTLEIFLPDERQLEDFCAELLRMSTAPSGRVATSPTPPPRGGHRRAPPTKAQVIPDAQREVTRAALSDRFDGFASLRPALDAALRRASVRCLTEFEQTLGIARAVDEMKVCPIVEGPEDSRERGVGKSAGLLERDSVVPYQDFLSAEWV